MNAGRYYLGSVVVFIYFFIAEWIFHGLIMSTWYNQYPHLMRPDLESGMYMFWMLIGLLLLAFGFCFIFIKGYKGTGIVEGVRFGLYVGLTFAVTNSLIEFGVFPYPVSFLIGWIIGYPIMMILAGIIFAAIYGKTRTT
jgi:hypothetical protein